MENAALACKKIAERIREKSTSLLDAWEKQVRLEIYQSRKESSLILIDHLPDFIEGIAETFELEAGEDKNKRENKNAAKAHGKQRAFKTNFSLADIIKEYGVLRDLLLGDTYSIFGPDFDSLRLLLKIIDQAIESAVNEFSSIQHKVIHSERIKTEASHRQLREFFMQAPIALVILEGPQHRFVLANPPYERLVGRKVVGKSVLEAFTEEEVSHFVPLLDGVYKTGKPYIGKELPLIIPNESGELEQLWIDLGYHPLRDATGDVSGIIAVVIDVSDLVKSRKVIEQSEAKLEAIFQQSPAAMALWAGKDLVFEKINEAYQSLFPGRKLLGLPFLEALPEFKDQGFGDLLLKVLETGKPFIGHEVLARHPRVVNGPIDDAFYDFSYVQVKDQEGNPVGVYDHAIDVTEKVKNRQALEEATVRLKNYVSLLEQERELRERFVAALSHDLRIPLTATKMSAQVLIRKLDDPTEINKLATRIISNMDRADSMIRDILDASRIKAGEKIPLEIHSCELNHLAEQTIENLSTMHGDRFKLKAVRVIKGFWDCEAVQRIIENLANNAVKYGNTSTPVTIFLDERDESVQLAVHNQGNPIPEKELNTIFEPYQRISSNTVGQKGWGIGLTLVNGFVQAHGGNVRVRSETEEGTTFTVQLPLDARKAYAKS